MQRLFLLIFLFIPFLLYSQSTVKGVVLEANSGGKKLQGVQVTALSALASEVSDTAGKFSLEFPYKKPGDKIIINFIKTGYEVLNTDLVNNWIIPTNPDYLFIIKLCPVGYIDKKTQESYENQYRALQASYEKQKKQLDEDNIDNQTHNQRLKELEEQMAFAEKFARIDFDNVSDLNRKAYELFMQGKLDSVDIALEQVDLMERADKRIQEKNNINQQQYDLEKQRQEKELNKQKDIQGLSLLARTYIIQQEYDKAAQICQKILQIDSTNIDNLVNAAACYKECKNYDCTLLLNKKILSYPDIRDWQKADAYGNIGDVLMELGNFEQALAAFESNNSIYNQLFTQNRDSVYIKKGLSRSYSRLGFANKSLGDLDKALGFYLKFSLMEEDLCRNNSNIEDDKSNLVDSYSKLIEIYTALGNSKKSKEFLNKLHKLQENKM